MAFTGSGYLSLIDFANSSQRNQNSETFAILTPLLWKRSLI